MVIKKSKMPRTWPVPRKGDRFVAVPSHSKTKGITVLVVLRDILKIAKNRKEARYMTYNGLVKINSIIRKSEDFPVQIFDTISLEKNSLHYRLEIVNRKFSLKEISVKEAEKKVAKIIGKKIIEKKKVQMNLDDGQNFIFKTKFSVGDSVLIDSKSKKVEKVLALTEGANVEVVLGKHAGEKGSLVSVDELRRAKSYNIKLNGGIVSLPLKTFLVIE